jgi:hypothetical protein
MTRSVALEGERGDFTELDVGTVAYMTGKCASLAFILRGLEMISPA